MSQIVKASLKQAEENVLRTNLTPHYKHILRSIPLVAAFEI